MLASKTRITTMLWPRNHPVVGSPSPRVQNKRGEVLERSRGLDPLIKDWGILVNDQEVQKFKKRTVFVFAVYKRLFKIFRSTKDTVRSI